MEYLINKTASEKLEDCIKFYWKKENSLVLYWHFKTVYEEIKAEANNSWR